jgi:hypothetical protein
MCAGRKKTGHGRYRSYFIVAARLVICGVRQGASRVLVTSLRGIGDRSAVNSSPESFPLAPPPCHCLSWAVRLSTRIYDNNPPIVLVIVHYVYSANRMKFWTPAWVRVLALRRAAPPSNPGSAACVRPVWGREMTLGPLITYSMT